MNSLPTGSHPMQPSPLPDVWTLPDGIRNRLGRGAGAQRSMFDSGHLLIILHQIPDPDETGRRPAFFWRDPDGNWSGHGVADRGSSPLGTFFEGYGQRLQFLEGLEASADSAEAYHNVLESLGPILRAVRGMHRALQSARESVPDDREIITFRDEAASLERTAELLLQDARFGLDYTVARQAEAQAENARRMAVTSHRLNILAALFLPLTALAGLFSMHFHSPLGDTTLNFFGVLTAGVLAGALTAVLISRGRRPEAPKHRALPSRNPGAATQLKVASRMRHR